VASIIGSRRVKYARFQASKRYRQRGKNMPCYEEREQVLRSVGYTSYSEYLKSPEWQAIRKAQLGYCPDCLVCGRKADQVHHLSYSPETILGWQSRDLASLCRACHRSIELDGKKKRTLIAANQELLRGVQANGNRQLVALLQACIAKATRADARRRAEEQRLEDERRKKQILCVRCGYWSDPTNNKKAGVCRACRNQEFKEACERKASARRRSSY
jgi:hypothetical protein